ncbi:MAG: glycosyltransferase family 25 protein [Verrucomicrobiota bacterium]
MDWIFQGFTATLKDMLKRIKASLGRLPLKLLYAGYPRLAAFLQRLWLLRGKKPVRSRVLYFIKSSARLYEWENISHSRNPISHSAMDYPVILINRDCDSRRLAAFQQQAERWQIPFRRHTAINAVAPGFDFSPYANEIGDTFYGKSRFLKGAVGCFLSHVRAWQCGLAKGDVIGLICEDDARLLGPLPVLAADFGIPPDADLVFANQRMADGLLQQQYVADLRDQRFLMVPANVAFFELLKFNSNITGPGGDGYILTRKGAEKLLRIYARTKVSMEVDWFLVFHSLTDDEMRRFRAEDGTGRFDLVDLADERLNSYVLLPSLVEQSAMGSGINFDRQSSYLERSEMFPNLR